ncbi:MAG TPA: hypothetical protein PLS53_15055 [Thermoanaerobaculaceae bacterium]|nr:hypothetical protein [Thermoanaerobaculaceae bacterium]
MTPTVSPEWLVLAEVLEREFRNARRMLGAFPSSRLEDRPPDCSHTARELAWAFVQRERLMLYVLRGRTSDLGKPAPEQCSTILAEYDEAHRESRRAIARLSPEQWRERISGPAGLQGWETASRLDLLWSAWKELVHHVAHFAVHLRVARQAEAARETADAHALSTAG